MAAIEVTTSRVCAWCSGPVPLRLSGSGMQRKHCSAQCRRAYAVSRAKERFPRTCQQCQGSFTTPYKGQKYCSVSCRDLGSKLLPLSRVCVVCNSDFKPRGLPQKCCSRLCQSKLTGSITRSRYGGTGRMYDCRYCGKHFRPRHPSYRTYCSRDCYYDELAVKRGEKPPAVDRPRDVFGSGRHTSKAVRLSVFERDGGICKLCGRKVDLTLRAPHPESMTLDHILPLSKGGSNDLANVQLAHYRCNSLRQDRDPAQMRLIG